MPDKILEGCQGQNDVPRHGVLAADRPPSELFRHIFTQKGQNYKELPNVIAINLVDFNFPKAE
jgi:hypothetical protein